ncbi:MAG: hypothetical protein AB1798_11850 [Spirochaetota bacterium]
MAWYKEKNIQLVMKKRLQEKGFKITVDSSCTGHGVDLKAYHPKHRYYWIVEVKGYPIGYSESAQRQNYFWQILGQIFGRITQENAEYGVCLPDYRGFYKKKILSKDLEISRRRLYLSFFLVTNKGKIYKLSPSGIKFQRF